MGKIADNAEQQKHNNAAPQQKIFHFAALGEPLGIPPATGERAEQLPDFPWRHQGDPDAAGECKNERCRSPDMPDR